MKKNILTLSDSEVFFVLFCFLIIKGGFSFTYSELHKAPLE